MNREGIASHEARLQRLHVIDDHSLEAKGREDFCVESGSLFKNELHLLFSGHGVVEGSFLHVRVSHHSSLNALIALVEFWSL